MGFVRCDLPHPLFLVLPERCLAKAAEDYQGIPLPQTAAEVELDFLAYAESGLLALVDDKQPDNVRISFCTPRYELVCGLTQHQDAYFAQRLAPLSLRTHNQIARGAVLVVPHTWGAFEDVADLNRQAGQAEAAKTGIEAILAAWKQLRQQPTPAAPAAQEAGLAPEELAFLSNVDTLIDLACQVELEKAARQERIPVKAVDAAALERYPGRAFRFQLGVLAEIRIGEYLRTGSGAGVDAAPGFDGVVVEAGGAALVLRFLQPVDLKQLQRVEWLAPKISTRQYTIQHEAVRALRNGEALNLGLLPLIVGNRFATYNPPAIQGAGEKPNPAQQSMIERALLVPDMLLALGPPGTGKTDTIRAIVARQAALGKKVLVTSKNNKAVDNVLEGLKNVQAVRIGREEAVAPEVRPMLVDNLAQSMQQGILDGIRPVQANLDDIQERWPHIQQVIERLAGLLAEWRQVQAGLDRDLADLTAWQRAAHTRVQPSLDRQMNQFHQLSITINQAARRADGLRARLAGLQRLGRAPLIGVFFILLAEQFSRDWQEAAGQVRQAVRALRQSRENTGRIWEAYRQFATAGEQALRFKSAVVQAAQSLVDVRAAIAAAQTDLIRLSENLAGSPALPAVDGSQAALETALWEWRGWYELMMRRRTLLAEWRDLLQTRPQALYPALIRAADVIGATCIGIATDARFEDLAFDMVIADEAGQIQVMDLLVPLVRARRAVLVGDHLQLPPVVEPEITRMIRENEPENQELGEWLEKSLFERIIERPSTPDSNRVMLDIQYRMPRQIADFISAQFYGGNYHTGVENPHEDPFFSGSPLVFVDTMREFRHFEQRSEDGQGYFNPLEAGLISDLLLAYQGQAIQAGVIVPYKKQAEKIRRELRRRQAGLNEDELVSRVATVDSFQGREQDVIIFGFTRSNTEGRIGFLTELRRLNVSLTRARRQLVLVGDSVTLTETADQDFALLAKALLSSVKTTPKGYFYASDLPARLQR